jgi:hypothetical protein
MGHGAKSQRGDKDRGLIENRTIAIIINGSGDTRANLIFNIAFLSLLMRPLTD